MVIPAPRLQRVVLVAILDRDRGTVLLSDQEGSWSPMACPAADPDHSSAHAANYARALGIPTVHIGAVVGRIWASMPAAASGGRIERQLLLTIPDEPLSSADLGRISTLGHARPTRWWSPAELRRDAVRVLPSELPDVVDGYWEGWLPDGPLTLAWD